MSGATSGILIFPLYPPIAALMRVLDCRAAALVVSRMQRSAPPLRRVALLISGPTLASVEIGPGSAEQREGRCTVSGTREEFALAAFLHQTRLINLRRGHSVPRTQRSAQRCAAEPGSISQRRDRSRLCGAARRTLHRVRDTSEMCSHRIPSSDTSDKPPAVPAAFPGRSAARSGALLIRGPPCYRHYGSRLCAGL
jgi:hypothetical protein